MKLLTCDHTPRAGLTLADSEYRARHFDICTAGSPEFLPQMRAINPALKMYGYLQPTRRVSWTNYILGEPSSGDVLADLTDAYIIALAAGCKEYVADFNLDGLFIDEPFIYAGGDWRRVTALIAAIETAIAPKHCMVNFGDYGAWLSTFAENPLASQLAWIAREHFAQVAVDTSKFQPREWLRVLDMATKRINGSRLVILGVYDPDRVNEELAAALMISGHPSCVWHYHTARPPLVDTPEQQVNPLLEGLR